MTDVREGRFTLRWKHASAIVALSGAIVGFFLVLSASRVDLVSLFGLDSLPPEPDPGHTFANGAIPEILFWKHRDRTMQLLPALRLVAASKTGFLLGPATRGFSGSSLVPDFGYGSLLKVEDLVTKPFANWLTGMHMVVVLERV